MIFTYKKNMMFLKIYFTIIGFIFIAILQPLENYIKHKKSRTNFDYLF